MNKSWQVVLAFIVVFLAGGAIGSVFTLRYAPTPKAQVVPAAVVGVARPEDFGPPLMRRWLLNTNQFKLTPAQREKIRLITFDTAEDMRRLQVENVNSGNLLIDHMQDEIASVLTQPQRDRYYQQIQLQRDKIAKFRQELQRRFKEQERADQAQRAAAAAK